MAGQGPAPKHNRQRRVKPARGEWIDLPPLETSVLPELPEGEWSERTLNIWTAWRQDPVTSQYGPSEIEMAIDAAYLHNAMVANGFKSKDAIEVRQWVDRLGLNLKGKRDLRFQVTSGEAEEKPQPASRERSVRAV